MRRSLKISIAVLTLLGIVFVIPERIVIPVEGASVKDWNPQTFWFESCGSSGVGTEMVAPLLCLSQLYQYRLK